MQAPADNIKQLHDKKFEIYLSAQAIQNRISVLGEQISRDYEDKNPILLCILNGAFIFAADLARAITINCEVHFVKLSSYLGAQSTGTVKTIVGLDVSIMGRHVIVVEDIVDTGLTMQRLLRNLWQEEPLSTAVASCFVKPSALLHPLDIAYTGFEIPNLFIIGYGLDYNKLGRNFADVYIASGEIH